MLGLVTSVKFKGESESERKRYYPGTLEGNFKGRGGGGGDGDGCGEVSECLAKQRGLV